MPNEEQRLKKPRNNPDSNFIILSNEPLPADEFDGPAGTPDFWGIHADRFKKGFTKSPITIEHPKQTYILNKGAHYFVVENNQTRSIKCITCPIQHGGILEAKFLTQYRVEDGVLYFKGKAINNTPNKSVVDNAIEKS